MYKTKCGFRDKVHVCSFKERDCSPANCDMYNIPFTSKDIGRAMDALKEKQKRLQKDIMRLKDISKLVEKERQNPKDEDVIAFKLRWREFEDACHGIKHLQKAYTYCKRASL